MTMLYHNVMVCVCMCPIFRAHCLCPKKSEVCDNVDALPNLLQPGVVFFVVVVVFTLSSANYKVRRWIVP